MRTVEQMEQELADLTVRYNKLDKQFGANQKTEADEIVSKMVFPTNNTGLRDNLIVPQKPKRVEDFSFEEIALGRLILNARGGILPDALEKRFQDDVRKYTMIEDSAAIGQELVPTPHWGQLFQDARSATKVAGLLESVFMTSKTMELCELGDAVFYKPAGEAQAVTATDLATAKRTLTAYELKSQVDIGDRLDEDAIIAMLPAIRSRLILNASETIDEAILCADASTGTQNINYYAATGGSNIATDSRFLLGFDGLIHYCLNEVTGQKTDLSTLETTDFLTLIGLLAKYADNPERCVFVIDRYVKVKALGLDDFETVDKLGAKATLLTGQIATIYGIPVIMSGALAKSNATGQVDQTAESNTKGRVILVNRDMWKVGFRRTVRVASERSEAKGLTSLVCSFRIGLQCLGDRSSEQYTHTALGYNTTV